MAKVNCDRNPIYCQIKKNSPSINGQYAMQLSNIIYKMHKKYGIPSNIFTAILMQESKYTLTAKGRHCGYTKDFKKICVYSDYGISQIHYKSAELWKFDVERLTKDLEYSVEAGAKILQYFMKRFEQNEPDKWYSRYNCGTASNVDRDICKEYKTAVDRYL